MIQIRYSFLYDCIILVRGEAQYYVSGWDSLVTLLKGFTDAEASAEKDKTLLPAQIRFLEAQFNRARKPKTLDDLEIEI